METKRFDVANALRLDAPERYQWLPPAEVVEALHIEPGEIIADIGAGTGYFTCLMAKAASAGVVYAVDAQQGMLDILASKLNGSISNVHPVHAEAETTGLPSTACSLVFLANVWHEFDDRSVALDEVLRILKRPGKIAILDWRPDVERVGGPPLNHRLSPRETERELAAHGFESIASRNIGRYSWLVQATIPAK
jgi:ubiquinone/menaquinone biosynthesis C-methylase UbiE